MFAEIDLVITYTFPLSTFNRAMYLLQIIMTPLMAAQSVSPKDSIRNYKNAHKGLNSTLVNLNLNV